MPLTLIEPDDASRRPVLAAVTEPHSGMVRTSVEPGRAIVWLIGQIDAAFADELDGIGRNIPLVAPHVVLDPTRMTFCDGTLADFLRALTPHVPVTIRRPPLFFRQMLQLWRLTESVQIADFPGPAPTVPA